MSDDSPKMLVSPMELGKFKIRQHEFPQAEKAFLEEATQNPNNAEAWFLVGACRKKLYRFEESLDPIEKAYNLEPTNPEYVYELALTYKSLGKLENALETAQKLASLSQNRYDAQKLIDTLNK